MNTTSKLASHFYLFGFTNNKICGSINQQLVFSIAVCIIPGHLLKNLTVTPHTVPGSQVYGIVVCLLKICQPSCICLSRWRQRINILLPIMASVFVPYKFEVDVFQFLFVNRVKEFCLCYCEKVLPVPRNP